MKKIILLLFFISNIALATVTLPYTFGTTVPASQANANFSALRDEINNHEAATNPHNVTIDQVLKVDPMIYTGEYINFNDSQLFSARIENVTTDPACSAANAGQIVYNTSGSGLQLCDGSSFVLVPSGSALGFNFINETPTGSINGTNTTFTLSQTPLAGSFKLYEDGLLLVPTTDYTQSGNTVTMTTAPNYAQVLQAQYAY